MNRLLLKVYAHVAYRLGQLGEWHQGKLLARMLLRGSVSVGACTYGLRWNTIDGASGLAPVVIGAYCSIAPGVKLLANVDHPTHRPSTFPFKSRFGIAASSNEDAFNRDAVTRGPIRIGSDVWLGQAAIVLSGVTIGDGCVVGAGSVVSRDLPPYSVAVGNPCRVVRTRFDEQTVERLLALRWWDLPPECIRKHIDLFYSDDIESFIREAESLKARMHRTVSARGVPVAG